MKKYLNENLFTFLFAILSTGMAAFFIRSPEGRASTMETFSIGLIREAFFLSIVFGLIKMLQGIDVDLKEDLFKTANTTTAFICALIIGMALILNP